MSQYTSRIHIKVKSPHVWEKFIDQDDGGFGLAELADGETRSFVIDGEWSALPEELDDMVYSLAGTLGQDGIIIADTTNINVSPFNYCVFCLGDEVWGATFRQRDPESDQDPHEPDRSAMHFETEITDIPQWLTYGGFAANAREHYVLFHCDILATNNGFVSCPTAPDFPDLIYLRETSFENRTAVIEKLRVGDPVRLVPAPEDLDPLRLEAVTPLGSIGFLPSQTGDKLTPLLEAGHLDYQATIRELIPLSRRNPHARSAIVGLEIRAAVAFDPPPCP